MLSHPAAAFAATGAVDTTSVEVVSRVTFTIRLTAFPPAVTVIRYRPGATSAITRGVDPLAIPSIATSAPGGSDPISSLSAAPLGVPPQFPRSLGDGTVWRYRDGKGPGCCTVRNRHVVRASGEGDAERRHTSNRAVNRDGRALGNRIEVRRACGDTSSSGG